MSLAHHYAAVLKELEPKAVFSYMKKKGHLSLLPQVLRVLEREQSRGDVITVAKKEDATSLKKQYPDARVVVDPKVVGGHSVRTGFTLVDRTYRTALVSLYQKIISL